MNLSHKINVEREAFERAHPKTCNCRRGKAEFEDSFAFLPSASLRNLVAESCCGIIFVKMLGVF